ncbi:MAG: DUF58 domain-containing protein [Alphaproteobacteria bacterium]|nr:DUF58 domain-containing protein [Alphaproteobacteria bacterium]
MGAARTGLVERLSLALDGAWRERVRVRPTRAGGAYVLILAGVLFAAVRTGNNLLYVVLAAQLAVLVLSNLLAEVNLRGLEVRRHLPGELFAGSGGVGAFELVNRRGRFSAVAVRVEEVDAGEASGLALLVPPQDRAMAPARWRLPARGVHHLGRVSVWSEYPFGLVRRSRVIDLPAEVLVYPAERDGPPGQQSLDLGLSREDPLRRGREGDFQTLRPYQPGDPLRDLHWPTTARTRRPMVVVRSGVGAPEVLVRVPELSGQAWERALSRAVGRIERHCRQGDAVGLQIEGQLLEPRTGPAWRRQLLTRLALASIRAAPPGAGPAEVE